MVENPGGGNFEISVLQVNGEHLANLPDGPKTKDTVSILNLVRVTTAEAQKVDYWPPTSRCFLNQEKSSVISWPRILDHIQSSFPQHLVHFFLKCLSLYRWGQSGSSMTRLLRKPSPVRDDLNYLGQTRSGCRALQIPEHSVFLAAFSKEGSFCQIFFPDS